MKSTDNGKEEIFVCYKGNSPNSYVLHRLDFDDTKHNTKLYLHYAVIELSNDCYQINFESRELLLKAISGFAIIHPMVTKEYLLIAGGSGLLMEYVIFCLMYQNLYSI